MYKGLSSRRSGMEDWLYPSPTVSPPHAHCVKTEWGTRDWFCISQTVPPGGRGLSMTMGDCL